MIYPLFETKSWKYSVIKIDLFKFLELNFNWVSVRYAEELNSGKSSVTLQRADRHGILG